MPCFLKRMVAYLHERELIAAFENARMILDKEPLCHNTHSR